MKLKVTELTLEDFVKDTKKEFYGKTLKEELDDTIKSFELRKDGMYTELEELKTKLNDENDKLGKFKAKKDQIDDEIYNEVVETLEQRIEDIKRQIGRVEYAINNNVNRIKDLQRRYEKLEELKKVIELVDFI